MIIYTIINTLVLQLRAMGVCRKNPKPKPETREGPSSQIFAGNFDLVLPKVQQRYRALRQGSSFLMLFEL